ncbi:MAG: pyridoxamine kinase [Lentisphaeria bacterium]
MLPNVKKVAAIHDLSGYGRASLTCIIPTLSAMGVQVCPLPTAILSTHSGGFKDFTFHDLTDIMVDYVAHWKKLGLKFDCVYSGFLGSPRQCEIVSDIMKDFRTKSNLIVIDPVMGDNGKLYQSISADMVPKMRKLIDQADILVPNYTEAALLLKKDSKQNPSLPELKDWLKELSDHGPGTVLITSAPCADTNKIHTIAYERESNNYWKVSTRRINSYYPGTGDIFASVMIGSLLQGDSLPIAIERGVQFISQCILTSRSYDYPSRSGVLLEKELHLLRGSCIIRSYEEI